MTLVAISKLFAVAPRYARTKRSMLSGRSGGIRRTVRGTALALRTRGKSQPEARVRALQAEARAARVFRALAPQFNVLDPQEFRSSSGEASCESDEAVD